MCKDGSTSGLLKGGIRIASAASFATEKGVEIKGGNDVCMDDMHSSKMSVSMPILEDDSFPLDGVFQYPLVGQEMVLWLV